MASKEIILDESILDIDSWLPKEAIDQVVQAILYQEKLELKSLFECNLPYFTESSVKNVKAEFRDFVGYTDSYNSNKSAYKVQAKDMAA